jgi:release factor glutamine methyltransferase
VERAHLHAAPAAPVSIEDIARYRDLVARRAMRVPLQHLTGEQEFWSLRFEVTPAVLIPRPETEHVVEAFLELNRLPNPIVLDIGTGSGCLAIAVAHEVPGALVHATDLSEEALMVARRNATNLDVAGRIAFYRGDLFEPLEGRGLLGQVDFILSNPPYIAAADLASLEPEVRDHEPRQALTPGPDPFAIHRRLARESSAFLKPGGFLIVEIGQGQERSLGDLYRTPGTGLGIVQERPDLAGIPRVLAARADRGAD